MILLLSLTHRGSLSIYPTGGFETYPIYRMKLWSILVFHPYIPSCFWFSYLWLNQFHSPWKVLLDCRLVPLWIQQIAWANERGCLFVASKVFEISIVPVESIGAFSIFQHDSCPTIIVVCHLVKFHYIGYHLVISVIFELSSS